MPDARGSKSKSAFRKDRGLYGAGPAITYPQTPGATDLAATHQIPFTKESIKRDQDRSTDASLVGTGAAPPSDIIGIKCPGPVESELRYRGWERLLMIAMGFEQPDDSPAFIGTGEGTKAVTNATNTTPIVITVAAHGYSNGDGIQIAGVGGNTAANGDWVIAAVTTNTFELVGSAGSGAYTSGGTAERFNAAAHLFEMDDCLQDQAWAADERDTGGWSSNDKKIRRGMFATAKQVSDWIWHSVMVSKWTLSATPDEVKLAMDFIAYNGSRGSYNSANWTLPAGSTARALFQQLAVRFGLRSNGDAAASALRVNSVELACDNKLLGDDQSTGSGIYIEQAVRGDFAETTLSLGFPRYSDKEVIPDDTWDGLGELDSEFLCALEFTGAQIGTTGAYRKYGFYMPSLKYKAPEAPVEGSGPIRRKVDFVVERPGGTDPFAALRYQGIRVVKDCPLRLVTHNEDMFNYLTEV